VLFSTAHPLNAHNQMDDDEPIYKLDRYITGIETSFRMSRKKDDSKNSGIENSTNWQPFRTILANLLTTEKGNC
jgi:hypothetical protein